MDKASFVKAGSLKAGQALKNNVGEEVEKAVKDLQGTPSEKMFTDLVNMGRKTTTKNKQTTADIRFSVDL